MGGISSLCVDEGVSCIAACCRQLVDIQGIGSHEGFIDSQVLGWVKKCYSLLNKVKTKLPNCKEQTDQRAVLECKCADLKEMCAIWMTGI